MKEGKNNRFNFVGKKTEKINNDSDSKIIKCAFKFLIFFGAYLLGRVTRLLFM